MYLRLLDSNDSPATTDEQQPIGRVRAALPQSVGWLLVAALYLVSRPAEISVEERARLAGRFQFEQLLIPLNEDGPSQVTRVVHPSLTHVAANVSFVGAAAALGDLDGDGLPNDLISVDPRVDQIVVAPAPGSSQRFSSFVLNAGQLPFDATNTAPMGTLIGDFDEDGRSDILSYYWGRSPILHLCRAAQDQNGVPSPDSYQPQDLVDPPQRWYTNAVTQADLDGDGHLDLIVGNYYPDDARILDPRGTGLEQMPQSLSRATNGGRSRLFLSTSTTGGEVSEPPESRRSFREATGVLPDEIACGWTFAVGAADLDGDLLPEIYFVQDFGPDRLLHNRSRPGQLEFALLNGERRFTSPRSKVLGNDSFNGMGVDFGDINNDGVLDLFVSNITSNFGLHESHFLFVSRANEMERMQAGIAPYADESEAWGVARGGWAWDVRLADFDNDGVLEALQAAGFQKGTASRWPELQELAVANDIIVSDPRTWMNLRPGDDVSGDEHNPFFVRASDGRYYDVAAAIGIDRPMCTRGIALADIDGDGRLDFATANQWESSYVFYNRCPNAGRSLGLHLRLAVEDGGKNATTGVHSGHPQAEGASRPAIGAQVSVELPEGRRLTAQVDGGSGHSGKRSPDVMFGLGAGDPSEKFHVKLRWRGTDGTVRSETLQLTPGWHTVLLRDAT